MTYYGKIEAGGEREAAAEGSKLQGQSRGEGGHRAEALPRRSHWAWAVAKGHHDWMDSHTPFARHE